MNDKQSASASSPRDPLFEGDRGSLTIEGRRALVMLLKNTHLSSAQHETAWEAVLAERGRLQEIFNEMFLVLHIDERAGVAYKTQAEPQEGQKFNTLLNQRPLQPTELRVLLRLRQLVHEGAIAGQSRVTVTGRELLDQLAQAYPDHKGDHVAAREQDKAALRHLAGEDILVPPRGSTNVDPEVATYTISGIVEAIVTPSWAKFAAQTLRNDASTPADPEDDDDAEADVEGGPADEYDEEEHDDEDSAQGDLLDELDEEEQA